jgi:ubiquinone/menaquinone biosynthesis C-methylase UbiE
MEHLGVQSSLFQGLSGRILDAGVGTGRNIAYYPAGANVLGIDLSPAMLARAERRAKQIGRQVELHQMDVTRLAFPNRSFDAAVASFLFCVLSNDLQVPAPREIERVLKPGGILRLLEYMRPTGTYNRAFVARLWEPWTAYGTGFDRHTEEHVTETNFDVVESGFVVPDLMKMITLRARDGPLNRLARRT